MWRLSAALSLLAALACAQQGAPPGGPPDPDPPVLIDVAPDSGAIDVRPPRVIFRYDEVVSEQPAAPGVQRLEGLVLISPWQGVPEVDWRRDELAIRPREGWRPNTVYTVTVLPGLRDLRGNVRADASTVIFSTGGPIPETRLLGQVFDWPAGRVAPRAWVEAIAARDSTVYVTAADTLGAFTFAHLPPGPYVVKGFLDQNANRMLEAREAYDSVAVTLFDTMTVELLAFVHDTVGPRLDAIRLADSVTLRVTFDQPLDSDQSLGPGNLRVVGPDSVPVPIEFVMTAPRFEAQRRAADTAAVEEDTVRAPAVPLPAVTGTPAPGAAAPSRPAPPREIVARLERPLAPSATYRIRAEGVRGLLGAIRPTERTFTTPRPPPPPRADTAAPGAPPPPPP